MAARPLNRMGRMAIVDCLIRAERKVFMKHIKKVVTLALAFAMVLAMSVSVFAAGNHTVTAPSDRTNHTYQIYQVFTGTADGNSLTNLKYGKNAVGTENTAVSQADMEALKTIEAKQNQTDQQKIEDMSQFVNLESAPIAEIGKGKEASASLAEGYYIIKDTDNSLSHPDTYTLYMFKVLNEDLTLQPKDSTTTSDKAIGDSNSSTDNDSNDITDTDIGKDVPYTLTVTLPANYADYKDFYLNFVDDMSKGLTYNGDAKIFYGASDTEGTAINFAAVSGTSYTDGQKYEYKIADLKSVDNDYAKALKGGDVVKVTYTAKVNNNAVIGEAGNPNKFHVDYSNNPNQTGDGNPGHTPDDTTIVLTFKSILNKVDGDGNALTGADFKLEKKADDGTWVEVDRKEGTSAGSQFSFNGLGTGDYRLTETKVPTGYNEMSPNPKEFSISATYSIEGDAATVSELTGTVMNFTTDKSAGTLTANIENNSGATLPSTGGIGTVIFYVFGSLLVIGCGIVLISRKRTNN